MNIITKIKNQSIFFDSEADFIRTSNFSDSFKISNGILKITVTSHFERFFFKMINHKLFISDSLKSLSEICKLEVSDDVQLFYRKYGFVYPPFTIYESTFMASPYIDFEFKNGKVTFSSRCIENKIEESSDLESLLSEYFIPFKKNTLNILVSGGIDSSALLGILNSSGKLRESFMCNMSSLPSEGVLAEKLTKSIHTPFSLFNLDKDLTHRADELLLDKGELISDSISLVFPELFDSIAKPEGEGFYLVDGQGADSLLNGLPLNKIQNLWLKLQPARLLLSPLSKIPIFQNKTTPFKRKIYRLTKALRCIGQTDFRRSILNAMIEDDSIKGTLKLETFMLNDLSYFFQAYKDWHIVIRYLYMFKVLPAREMQKYLLAEKYNVKILAPFLDEKIIMKLMFLDNSVTMKKGLYKYPITKLAQKYWPGYFESSKTSPFQVNFKIGTTDLKQYSIDFVNKNVIK